MRSTTWIKRCAAAAATWCVLGTASAATMTLTFDTIGDTDLYPPFHAEDGFMITSLEPSGGHLHTYGAALALHSREGSSPYHFVRIDGGSFDFLGFDYFGGDSVFVTDGGATFTILGDQPLATFTMPASFHDVGWVDWYMTNPGEEGPNGEQWGVLDNVVTNVPPAPEPAQTAMLGLGLAALALWVRARRAP